jgi:uncharacterized repeat protein (TIGR03803 family)
MLFEPRFGRLAAPLVMLDAPSAVTTSFSSLLSFTGSVGSNPGAHPSFGSVLTAGTDANFYGTTNQGGAANYGTVFKRTPPGVQTTLVDFNGSNGAYPVAIFAKDEDYFASPVVAKGDTADGADGGVFASFKSPVNASGRKVAFIGALKPDITKSITATNNDGIWASNTAIPRPHRDAVAPRVSVAAR